MDYANCKITNNVYVCTCTCSYDYVGRKLRRHIRSHHGHFGETEHDTVIHRNTIFCVLEGVQPSLKETEMIKFCEQWPNRFTRCN